MLIQFTHLIISTSQHNVFINTHLSASWFSTMSAFKVCVCRFTNPLHLVRILWCNDCMVSQGHNVLSTKHLLSLLMTTRFHKAMSFPPFVLSVCQWHQVSSKRLSMMKNKNGTRRCSRIHWLRLCRNDALKISMWKYAKHLKLWRTPRGKCSNRISKDCSWIQERSSLPMKLSTSRAPHHVLWIGTLCAIMRCVSVIVTSQLATLDKYPGDEITFTQFREMIDIPDQLDWSFQKKKKWLEGKEGMK